MLSTFTSAVMAAAESPSVPFGFYAFAFIEYVAIVLAFYKLFFQAREKSWAFIVPIYNVYVLLKLIYGDGRRIIFLIIPILNILTFVMMHLRLAEIYGRTKAFAVGLMLCPFVFYPLLAYDGRSSYSGPNTDVFI